MSLVNKSNNNNNNNNKLSLSNIPSDIINNKELNKYINILPKNYNFEIHKTIWRVIKNNSKRVALQFPEGLLAYSMIISDIINKFAHCETVIMGDVTYGACCIDDYTALALDCDFMVHYGHSCLVPISNSLIPTLYVFVDIAIDTQHLINTLKLNFSNDITLTLAGTIQFAGALQSIQKSLKEYFQNLIIPQARPLSKGEVLGCTSPKLDKNTTHVIFVADGRFHLESLMIQNPHIKEFYKYNPYDQTLTREKYSHDEMYNIRQDAIECAKKSKKWGVIMGSLGRQGNPDIVQRLVNSIEDKGLSCMIVLLSEIFPSKLKEMSEIEVWVQVACPRLSIDWGYAFDVPLLNPYEANVALSKIQWQSVYPMDFYRKNGGEWTNYYEDEETKAKKAKEKAERRARFKARQKKRRGEIKYDDS